MYNWEQWTWRGSGLWRQTRFWFSNTKTSKLLYGRDNIGGQLGCRIFGFVFLFHDSLLKAQAALFEGDEATTGEEKMVQDLDIEQLAGFDQGAGNGDIIRAGR